MERKVWNEDEWAFDLLPEPTHGQMWWNGIEDIKKISDQAVLRITGKPTKWHEVVKTLAELRDTQEDPDETTDLDPLDEEV